MSPQFLFYSHSVFSSDSLIWCLYNNMSTVVASYSHTLLSSLLPLCRICSLNASLHAHQTQRKGSRKGKQEGKGRGRPTDKKPGATDKKGRIEKNRVGRTSKKQRRRLTGKRVHHKDWELWKNRFAVSVWPLCLVRILSSHNGHLEFLWYQLGKSTEQTKSQIHKLHIFILIESQCLLDPERPFQTLFCLNQLDTACLFPLLCSLLSTCLFILTALVCCISYNVYMLKVWLK